MSVSCAGDSSDRIAVGCQSGAVLTLNAAWLTDGGAAAWCEPAAAAAAAAALVRETPCAGGSSSVSKAEQQDEAEWVTDAEWGVSRYMEEEEEDILDLISKGQASQDIPVLSTGQLHASYAAPTTSASTTPSYTVHSIAPPPLEAPSLAIVRAMEDLKRSP